MVTLYQQRSPRSLNKDEGGVMTTNMARAGPEPVCTWFRTGARLARTRPTTGPVRPYADSPLYIFCNQNHQQSVAIKTIKIIKESQVRGRYYVSETRLAVAKLSPITKLRLPGRLCVRHAARYKANPSPFIKVIFFFVASLFSAITSSL